MRKNLRLLLGATGLLAVSAGALAHVRLINPNNGNPLFWNSPGNIGIVINSTGSDDVGDDSDELAVRMAIDSWNEVTDATSQLVENTDPAQQARTDWESSNIHLVWFDELNASGYFGGGGIVAVTPIAFQSNGVIVDADVLYNGSEWNFTTSGVANRFDIQDVGAHELGHLLGLNHSGVASSTMYPYVDPTVVLHRSLSSDDEKGLRHAYPMGGLGSFGQINGRVERADNSAVQGAYVVARDADGRTAGSVLTNNSGNFTLQGLDPGTYTVYASPLDNPVSVSNLGGGYTVQTDFQPAIYGTQAVITASENIALGTLQVGADVALNLGDLFDIYPFRVVEGETSSLTIRGTGLIGGTTLSVSDPDFTLSAVVMNTNSVTFLVGVPDGELPGHVDVAVTNGSNTSILPAAIEVTRPTPAVTNVNPTLGSSFGGTALTITGTDFGPGSLVVLGDQFYTDGVDMNVVDETTITLTTRATTEGMHDVVVMGESGVEDRLVAAFEVASLPTVTSVFPVAGASAGGTPVTLRGNNFQTGIEVRIDGVDQTGVVLVDATKLTFTTEPGVVNPGSVIEVENTDTGLAQAAFAYVAQPDPMLAMIDPPRADRSGGKTVTFNGSNFTATTEVYFGADADTGLGGTVATTVTLLDASTLEVVVPNHAKGKVNVMVSDATTQQACVLAEAFTFTSSGGGGGCYLRPLQGPQGPRDALLGSWWMAVLCGVVLSLRLRARRPAVQAQSVRR